MESLVRRKPFVAVIRRPLALPSGMAVTGFFFGTTVLVFHLHQEGFGPPTCCSSKVAPHPGGCGQQTTKVIFVKLRGGVRRS